MARWYCQPNSCASSSISNTLTTIWISVAPIAVR
jgi:hypothetical protein